ncbi:MAG: acyl-ACP--UDP-N-acetylglucosamine O-acyltransferase [Pirellulales bacterium]|nr:acyl-ACP--UDP-N-acetylglucosamine O-acyltransferase [Pirellulales bacterium]
MAVTIVQPAYVDPRAELADEVWVGPFSVIGPDVRIGRGTRIENNVTITGHVTIGEENHIYPNVVIGAEPQDISYRGSPTRVEIGHQNIIREGVTINRATEKEEGLTSLGDHNFLMACSHVAHDCRVGNHVLLANGALLGGHVRVQDHASLSGAVAVHHYATIGSYAFIAGLSRVLHDIPPYMLAEGHPARPRCVNIVALKRNNFSARAIHALAELHKLIYRSKVGLEPARELLRAADNLPPEVLRALQFLEESHAGRHGRAQETRRAA